MNFFLSFPAACPRNWKQFEEYCYFAYNYGQNWHMARKRCRLLNADLVKINSYKENEFVLQLVRATSLGTSPPVRRVWIGLFWHKLANQWAWSDVSTPVYTNWKQNEPNGNAGEPCGEMLTRGLTPPINGEWNDIACHHLFGFVCKKLA